MLVIINYFSVKLLYATRSYTQEEYLYSKARKTAALNLLVYLNTSDEKYYNNVLKQLKSGLGTASKKGENKKASSEKFSQNLNELNWFFQTSRNISLMKKLDGLQKEGTTLNEDLHKIAGEIHQAAISQNFENSLKETYSFRLYNLAEKASSHERAFSAILGNTFQQVKKKLFFANILIILLIIISTVIYTVITLKRLSHSYQEIKKKNNSLATTNHEMDQFLYSASHDLRAPITSLKGLVNIASTEHDPTEVKAYLTLMNQIIDQQDRFIAEIINFSRNKRTEISIQPVSLKKIIEDSIVQHRYMKGFGNFRIDKEIWLDEIKSDPLRLGIIFNNLISNGIKYSDETKEVSYLMIRTFASGDNCIIEIGDNGIGIKEENLNSIFDMFFVTANKNKGAGLGLYLVKETVEKLGGTIEVRSQFGLGTYFTITFPGTIHH